MRKIGNPAGCCCPPPGGSGCTVAPIVGFNIVVPCCTLTATVSLMLAGTSTIVWTQTFPTAGYGAIQWSSDLPPGTVLDWEIAIPGLATKSGTVTVPGCGQGVYVPPAVWTVIDLIGPTVNATATADDATVGGGGTWSGPLVWDGQVHFTPPPRGGKGRTTYVWEACVPVGSYGHETRLKCVYSFNSVGDCVDYSAYGGPKPSSGLDHIFVGKVFYQSTKITFSISYEVLPGLPPEYPDSACAQRLSFLNYWGGGCSGFSPGTAPPGEIFPSFFSDSQFYTCGFSEPEIITSPGQTFIKCHLDQAQLQTENDLFPRCAYPTSGLSFPVMEITPGICMPLDYYAELALNPCSPAGVATAHVTL